MERIEYKTLDKSAWAAGPWLDEPDKIQWPDEATGLPCLIVRHPRSGHLCGYVGVPADHPWHGLDYDQIGHGPKPEGYEPDWYIDVHGGLTYADGCGHGDPSGSICHLPGKDEPDDVWWLGFDCAHAGDLSGMAYPSSTRASINRAYGDSSYIPNDTYKDVDYVADECARLAQQAADNA